MNTTRSVAQLYTTLRRKLQRRTWYVPPLLWFGFVLLRACPLLCLVAWLGREHGWGVLFQSLRWLWWSGSLVNFLFTGLLLVIRHTTKVAREEDAKHAKPIIYLAWYTSLLLQAMTLLALLVGSIPWAVVTHYVTGSVNALASGPARSWSWRNRLQVSLLIIMVGVALAQEMRILIASVMLYEAIPLLFKPTLREIVIRKPSRREFVQQQLQQCAAGGG